MTRELTLAELSDFTNAKIGDKIYSTIEGEGKISNLLPSGKITVEYPTGIFVHYWRSGKTYEAQLFPEIFNRPVKIVAADTEVEK